MLHACRGTRRYYAPKLKLAMHSRLNACSQTVSAEPNCSTSNRLAVLMQAWLGSGVHSHQHSGAAARRADEDCAR